jgi:hypothetical protein
MASTTSDINGSSNDASTGAVPGAGAVGTSIMTYAKALTDAKTLIVAQSARIKSDARKLKAQSDEIAQLQATFDAMSAEIERLRAMETKVGEAVVAREHAEAVVGRQRMEIEALEAAGRQLQSVVGDQAARINELTTECDYLRAQVPSDEDVAALEQMAALLAAARAKAKPARAPAAGPNAPDAIHAPDAQAASGEEAHESMSGPALARLYRERQVEQARQREQRAARQSSGPREITIPAEPTPFCLVSERKAA